MQGRRLTLLVALVLGASACATPTRPLARHHAVVVPEAPPPARALAPPAPAADWPSRARHFGALVMAAADEFGVPRDLMLGLVWVESRFNPAAVSRAGARGLTQLMPATARGMARRLGVDPKRADPHEPRFAARAGAAYLSLMLKRFGGAETCALAAYNAGPGRVHKALLRRGRLPKRALGYAYSVQRARRRFAPADGARARAEP